MNRPENGSRGGLGQVQRIVKSGTGSPAPPVRPAGAVRRHRPVPGVRLSRFAPGRGPEEIHLLVEPDPGGSLDSQLEQLNQRYQAGLADAGLEPATALFRRFYLSDAANQLEAVMASPAGCLQTGAGAAAISCVEQPALPYRKVALQAYHLSDVQPADKTLVTLPEAGPWAHALRVRRPGGALLWAAQFTAGGADRCCCDQTRELFRQYDRLLAAHGATLGEHVVRTWLFVDGVDRHYLDVVEARREVFRQHGLTESTHYIVSTGIQGRSRRPEDLVLMDALALPGLQPEQLWYIDDLDHLNRTSDYGVTFERAARLDYGDRSHLLVAGTASIDGHGSIVHPGDLPGQVERTLENIAALLAAGGAGFEDVTVATAYLRDPADAGVAAAFLERLAPGLPWTMVQAPVCRPGWLIEIEAMAAVANDDPRWARY